MTDKRELLAQAMNERLEGMRDVEALRRDIARLPDVTVDDLLTHYLPGYQAPQPDDGRDPPGFIW